MSLLESVSEILKAIPAIEAGEVRLDEKHGIDPTIGLRLFDAKTMIRMLEINQEAEKLKAYLGSIDYETLLKLEALMYFGRDRDAPFAEKLENRAGDAKRRARISSGLSWKGCPPAVGI